MKALVKTLVLWLLCRKVELGEIKLIREVGV
jgi:hypothetical protein